ncbi:hypothetical protein CAC42_7581 [Sphaceloma murrayae]|uniref:Translation initiation factor 3 N-terminal domain-containing protein n=1 Tax=Sphaceloma murrayae TaxID=2082308 RepID=A0A2K1QT23_9PEZI|nr:hypothetical protein CAC42_7581 [Sphaceloma murrayae]
MASHGRAPLRALYNIFVRPLILQQTRQSPFPLPAQPRLRQPTPRPFTTTPSLPRGGPTKPSRKPQSSSASSTDAPLYNESIPARHVRVVDPLTNELGPVVTRRYALLRIDSDRERLVCASRPPRWITPSDPEYDEVAMNYDYIVRQYQAQQRRFGKKGKGEGEQKDEMSALDEEVEDDDELDEEMMGQVRRAPAIYVPRGDYVRLPTGEDWIPVCKVENKIEAAAKARAKEAERKEQRKLAPEGVKIMELNWAIGANDLGHRLKKVEGFLKGRRRVEVVIAPKRRGKTATSEEAEEVLRKVRECVAAVEGAKETRPMQGQVGGVASLMIEGKRGRDD